MIGCIVVTPPVVALEKANAPESMGTSDCARMAVAIQSNAAIVSKTLLIMQFPFGRYSRKTNRVNRRGLSARIDIQAMAEQCQINCPRAASCHHEVKPKSSCCSAVRSKTTSRFAHSPD
jgi:hypothetical protein